jgi:hypothetical protein
MARRDDGELKVGVIVCQRLAQSAEDQPALFHGGLSSAKMQTASGLAVLNR